MTTWCEKCGEIKLSKQHKCPPIFLVWCEKWEGNENSATEVRGRDAREAAENWAIRFDRESNYVIIGGIDVAVKIRPIGHAKNGWEEWIVSGNTVPNYSARQGA